MTTLVNHFSIDRLTRLLKKQEEDKELWQEPETYVEENLQLNLKVLHDIVNEEIIGRDTDT